MAWQQGWRMRQLALSCGSQQSFGSMQRPPSHRIYNFKIKDVTIVQLETNLYSIRHGPKLSDSNIPFRYKDRLVHKRLLIHLQSLNNQEPHRIEIGEIYNVSHRLSNDNYLLHMSADL